MEGRKKVREERQRGKRGKRNKAEWKIEIEGRNRGWRRWEGRKKKVFGTEREGSQRGMGDREGRKKEIEWSVKQINEGREIGSDRRKRVKKIQREERQRESKI